jgi:hypothetical protein
MLENGNNNGNGFYMPVAPAYSGFGGGYNNGFGGDWGWIILLLLCANGGFGFGGFGGWGGMMGMGMADGFGLYPWLNNSEHISDGFRDQQLNTNVTSVRDAISGLSTQLCNGFSSAEIAANGRQMADMNQMFSLQSALQNCCCENRLATANLGADIAREACADRAAVSDGIRDVITNQTAIGQRILDKLCDQELQAERRDNANLRSELMYARGQASQVEQTARILAGQAAEIDGVYNRLKNCPVPSMPVYGNTPIFTCAQNIAGSCGCNGNGFFN